MKKTIGVFLVIFLSSLISISAQYSNEPHIFMNNLTKEIIETLQENEKEVLEDNEAGARLVEPIIKPHVSFELMGKYILGPKAWKEASKKEIEEFKEALEELIIKSYAKTLVSVLDGQVKYYPPKASDGKKERVQIPSVVKVNNNKVHLVYRLVYENDNWKIYDILVERISIAKGFRAQFEDIVQQGGIRGVISAINNKT